MKLLFTHPQRFYLYNDNYYVGESFSSEILSRYTSLVSSVTFVARVVTQKADFSRMECITNSNLQIKDIKKIGNSGLEEEVKNTDYIITRLPSSLGLKTIKYAKKHNKPYLIELVGCPFDALWNHSLLGKPLAVKEFIQTRKAVLNAPFVLYVSSEFLPNKYPTKGKSIACSDVILDISDDVLPKRLERIDSLNKDKTIILGSIGAVNVKYKGYQYVVKAISRLKKKGYKIKYLLVGNGDQSNLINLAKKYNLSHEVKLLGGLAHRDVFSFLDDIDLYIQPSLTEGLPRALMEAMSRACPVIASRVGGIPELLNDDVLFTKKAVKEISRHIVSINNTKLKEEAIRNFGFIKNFDKNILDQRRNEFYIDFIKSNK